MNKQVNMMDVWMEAHHPYWDFVIICYNSDTFLTVISELAVIFSYISLLMTIS